MNLRIRKSLLAVAVSGLLAAPLAHATNGYFMHGYGSKEKGMAGAGVAYNHNDAMAAATNPAAMAFVDQRVDLGLQIFSPSPRGYTVTGTPSGFPGTFPLTPQEVESENDFFLLPHGAFNYVLNDTTTLGLAVYGNGGMNTEYKDTGANPMCPGTFCAGTAGINLEQMFFNFNSSYKLNSKHALGASLVFVGQRFRAQGLEAFGMFSTDPSNLSGNVNSYSYGGGIKLGYQGEVSEGVRVGISYQSKMSMGEFDEYKGLFAEAGSFDIPSTYTLGVSFDVGKNGVIVADYQRINYTDVASLSNPISNLTGTGSPPAGGCAQGVVANCLGGSNGAGFGWEDIGIFKVGYQWNAADMDWRVGYSHSDQAIPESEVMFNILAPATIQDHLTFGLTKEVGKTQEFNFSFMYGLNQDVTGPNPFEAPDQQTIKIEMTQIDLQAGWAWKF